MEQTKTHFWTEEEENTLAAIALQYLRDGKNLKDAMEEIANKLNRSVHSVNHRWTHFIKKDYELDIKMARKIGERVKKNIEESIPLTTKSPTNFDETDTIVEENLEKETVNKDDKPTGQKLKSDDFIQLLKSHILEYTDLVNSQNYFDKLMEEKELELNNAYIKIADLESKLETKMDNPVSDNVVEEIKKLRDINSKLEKQLRLAQPLLKAAIELDAALGNQ